MELFHAIIAIWIGQTIINLILSINLDNLNSKIEKLEKQLKEK